MKAQFVPAVVIFAVTLGSCARDEASTAGMRASLTATSASIAGDPTSLEHNYFGYNANVSGGPGWTAIGGAPSTPTFLGSVATLQPQMLRYPGGTVSNYWHWQTGLMYAGWPGNSPSLSVPNTLEEFANALHELEARGVAVMPIWTLNMMTRGDYDDGAPASVCPDASVSAECLEDQIAMLTHAVELGLPVRYVELGNEFYLAGPEVYTTRFANGAAYALEARRWIARLHADFPGVKVGIVGFDRDEEGVTGPDRDLTWNQTVHDAFLDAPSEERADGFVLHIYAGSGLRSLPGYGACDEAVCLQEAFDSARGVEAMMARPFIAARYFDTVASRIPAAAVPWSTEFNLADDTLVTPGTWAHGLYLALEEGLFSEHCSIALVHNLSGASGRYSLMFRDADQYAPFVGSPVTPVFGLSAAGYASSLFARAVQSARMRTHLTFSPNPMRGLTAANEYPALSGWLYDGDGDSRRAYIINASDEEFTLDVHTILSGEVDITRMHAEPHVRIVNSTDLELYEARTSGAVPLAPWSLTLLEEHSASDAGVDAGDASFVDASALDGSPTADASAITDAASPTDGSAILDIGVNPDAASAPPPATGCSCRAAPTRQRSWQVASCVLSLCIVARRRRTRAVS